MVLESLEYVADGAQLLGELAFDAEAPAGRPGLLVFPEGSGLNTHVKSQAHRLAQLGYIALAADLYGHGLPARDLEEGLGWVRTLTGNPARLRARTAAALEALATHPCVDPTRIAAIGFCFGGTAALELARSGAAVSGIVCFHGVLATAHSGDARNIKGRVLVCLGSEDPLVPIEQRSMFESEMNAAGVDWQMNVHGGAKHSFTNPQADAAGWPALAYNQRADARSWRAMQMFLCDLFPDAQHITVTPNDGDCQ